MEIRADLHIHTVLSPCGDLDMSPANIIGMALQKGLSLIGISDHNSTRQAPVIQQLGEQQGLRVLCGTEVNTAEEVHALAYFPTLERLTAFQHFLDLHLPDIKNNPDKFGYQVVVDAEEQITYEEERLLITALGCRYKRDRTYRPRTGRHLHPGPYRQIPFQHSLSTRIRPQRLEMRGS